MQREREMRGITLEEIANATKIGARSLRALELEEFDKLPGGIFNKGFVRSYARYVGIDEEQAVADYLAASGDDDEAKNGGEAERLQRLGANWRSAEPSLTAEAMLRLPWRSLAQFIALVAIALLAVHYRHPLLAHYQQWRAGHAATANAAETPSSPAAPAPSNSAYPQTQSLPVAEASPSPTPDAAPAPAAEVNGATSGQTPVANSRDDADSALRSSSQSMETARSQTETEATTDGSGREFVVRIRAREDSWVKVTADGKSVLTGVLSAQRVTAVHARQKITVVAGNAGGLELSFNGKLQPQLGSDKQVRTVTFTREGMQD
jgi:cytoskeleton protein RodZ